MVSHKKISFDDAVNSKSDETIIIQIVIEKKVSQALQALCKMLVYCSQEVFSGNKS